MYFNTNNQNTNIDNEFKNSSKKKKGNNKGSKNLNKKNFIIIGVVISVLVLVLLVVLFQSNRVKYYIDLNGSEKMIIYKDELFVEPGYRGYDNKGNDLTDDVKVNNMIDVSKIGEYEVTYTLSSKVKSRTVKIIEKPEDVTVIYLKGSLTVNLKVGEKYVEAGYKVIDNVDGDLNDKVVVKGSVDVNKVGIYNIVYMVTNSRGVTTTAQRKVIVK